jgi:uncharacterized NAD(P)/FAD-binding protein YdhS
MRVVRGVASETFYRRRRDGLVETTSTHRLGPGDLAVDPGVVIHSIASAGPELLVTVHLYAPPLGELRRHRLAAGPPLAVFTRATSAPTVAVVGGGFSGTMATAHLVRIATEARRPLHVVLLERAASFGDGAAYRTADARHLLNVPAGRMSAWPDRPDDLVRWAGVDPAAFIPRGLYGDYVRARFFETLEAAGDGVAVEIREAEVRRIDRAKRGWRLTTHGTGGLDAAAIVLATGHRPPDDPLQDRWTGPRARYLANPWTSLALGAIRSDEPVVLLGTGLTALDVVMATDAPIVAVSRHGLLPTAHGLAARDDRDWSATTSVRELVREARDRARALADWRSVVDGLRPHTARLWRALPAEERRRWMRHVRPFWEIHRHRMPPAVAARVERRLADGSLRVVAGSVVAARAGGAGVELDVRRRGGDSLTLAASWVVNCTGPGASQSTRLDPAIESLVEGGHLVRDELGLGVLTGPSGEASSGDLVVVGTLRKAQLWESTAVPELRVQAAEAARVITLALAD